MSRLRGTALHTLAFKRWETVRAVTPELLKLKVLAAGGLVGASGVALFSATIRDHLHKGEPDVKT
jgi:hypothetical protein